jgi:ATP-binding protein involved in chromosome partitioning
VALQTRQRVAGVVENMSWYETPDGQRLDLFGSGGGQTVADSLTRSIGSDVPLLGQVPLDPRLREAGDAGNPLVLENPDCAAATSLRDIAGALSTRARGLAGKMLNVTPA